ncbi:MAG TPA: hypothetical protein VLB84_16655 [Bacteroidia bacterium]|nr:hypothetical protein [Bacteroidia bacterium]
MLLPVPQPMVVLPPMFQEEQHPTPIHGAMVKQHRPLQEFRPEPIH